MSKDSNTQQRATRQHPPTKIIVEMHYVGTKKWKRKREYRIIGVERKLLFKNRYAKLYVMYTFQKYFLGRRRFYVI